MPEAKERASRRGEAARPLPLLLLGELLEDRCTAEEDSAK